MQGTQGAGGAWGEDFVERVRGQVAGDEREQRGARRLAGRRPELEAVIECVERIWEEKWEEFRDRHGDHGRDLVLYVGRRICGLKLLGLARPVGMREYATVAMAVKRYAGPPASGCPRAEGPEARVEYVEL